MTARKLLVLGGTSFVGRAIVVEALRRGHDVTTFNRGRSGPDVEGVHAVRGDRTSEAALTALATGTFDAVIDPGGQVPVQVLRSAQALRRSAPFYAYVSSAAVYRDWTRLPWSEGSPTHEAEPDADGDPADLLTLAPRKAGCERAVRQVFPGESSLVIRPGLIAGPHDNLGMLPWWLSRIGRGGDVLAPGTSSRALQLVDARDLADFVLDRVESARGGVFNTMPDAPITTIGEWLDARVDATGASARLVWVDDAFLLEHGGSPWNEIPFWLPSPDPRTAWPVEGGAARAAGLSCRPPAATVQGTWDWMRSGGSVQAAPGSPAIGLSPAKESQILDAWTAHKRQPA